MSKRDWTECLKINKAAKFGVIRTDLYVGGGGASSYPAPYKCLYNFTTLIFTLFGRIILKLGKLHHFKVLFPAVLIDICLLLFVKS